MSNKTILERPAEDLKARKEINMKELKSFAENFKAVFELEDIIAMIAMTAGTYFSVILISGILG